MLIPYLRNSKFLKNHFISNNLNDFGVEPDFDKDLFYGKKVSNQFRFRIINKLSNFIDQYIQPMKQLNNEFETFLQLSDITGINISDWLLLNMKDIIYDNGLGHAIMGLDEGYGTIMLHKMDFIKNIAVSGLTKTDENIAVGKILTQLSQTKVELLKRRLIIHLSRKL